jgi:DsbC/DsbD-like thiol-disulfide interchange protein
MASAEREFMRAFQAAIAALVGAIALAAFGRVWAAPPVLATDWAPLHAGRVRLVAGPAASSTGPSVLAGVEIELQDKWKTYWRMPGDSGIPPSFDWAKSGNVAAVQVRYPAPKRIPEPLGASIGYEHSVIFPVEITPRDPGKPVQLRLELQFGICRDICVPAEAKLELALPAGRLAGPAPPQVAAALERVPRPQAARRAGDPEIKRIRVEGSGDGARLTVEARFPDTAAGADLFIEAPEGLYVPLPKKIGVGEGGIVRFQSHLTPDLAKDLKGKVLICTLVGAGGASEARWTFR